MNHQISSFSPARWTKMVLQERAAFTVCIGGTVWYSITPSMAYARFSFTHNEQHLHRTLCRAHFLWTKRTGMLPFIWLVFQVWFLWASSDFVHSDDSSKKVVTFPLVPVQQGLCDCITVSLLHLGNFMGREPVHKTRPEVDRYKKCQYK